MINFEFQCLGHKNQADANFQMTTYFPLVNLNCAPELQLFLCSVYVPVCASHSPQKLIGPCRPLCEKVRRKCEPVLSDAFNYKWPEVLNCDKFPKSNEHDHMCIDIPVNGVSLGLPTNSLNALTSNQLFMDKVKEQMAEDNDKFKVYKPFIDLIKHNSEPAKAYNQECKEFKKSFKYSYIKKTESCLPKCNAEINFSQEEKSSAQTFVLTFASICLVSRLFTFVVYCVNILSGEVISNWEVSLANKSPIFLALSYVGYSLGYMIATIGVQKDEKWLCVDDLNHGARSRPCLIIFLFVYFFGSAISAWFTNVLLSWICAQVYKPQSKKSIENFSVFCHIYGWGIPAILTLIAILRNNFEADELTSVCYPGALHDNSSLLYFVIIPEGTQLFFGALLYLVGVALTCRKNYKSLCKTDAQALNSLKWRYYFIGAIYLLSKFVSFETFLYEYSNRDAWIYTFNSAEKPDLTQFWLRLGTSLVTGFALPVWVLSHQTKNTCFYMWNTNKTTEPSTFPTVPYRPQAMELHELK